MEVQMSVMMADPASVDPFDDSGASGASRNGCSATARASRCASGNGSGRTVRSRGALDMRSRADLPVLQPPLTFAGVELQVSTGMVRLRPEYTAAILSGQQSAVLAVLMVAEGRPLNRGEIMRALPRGCRPPASGQIGVVISHIRHKIGSDRILTGAGGWWLHDPTESPSADTPHIVSYADVYLDVRRQYVWFAAQQGVTGSRVGHRLGPQEFAVLRVLIEAKGAPRDGQRIFSSIPPHQRPSAAGTVGVIVHQLRCRIGRDRIVTGGRGWRLTGATATVAAGSRDVVSWAGVGLDRTTDEAWMSGRDTPIMLSPQQTATLRVLIAARGVPLSGERVWAEMPADVRPRNAGGVATIVSRLRRKLGRDRLVGGNGWSLTDPGPTTAA
ncbi:hypothetical protein [Micromonospora lupini]|uniref:hypothetical protein n=1 Tax=Micromonospora lupini TaxID=285679 RepID=UPI0031E2AC95